MTSKHHESKLELQTCARNPMEKVYVIVNMYKCR
jgi:hypothetical protein